MDIAIYIRVSTSDQEFENQAKQLREFAISQKWKVIEEFTDIASGKRSDRQAFQKLMDAASQKRFDVVLFWALDRFSREGVARTLHYLQLLESWGVGFRSYTEPYLDSLGVFKDAVLAILSCIAKQERIRISERTKAGLIRAKRGGKRLGRPCLHQNTAQQVNALRKQGKSFPMIARQLKISVGSAYNFSKNKKNGILKKYEHQPKHRN